MRAFPRRPRTRRSNHDDTANDVGTAFYPTRATVPVNREAERGARGPPSNRRATNRHDGIAAAQLHEALRRSKEEADLAEALRRSSLESRESRPRGGSRVAKTTDETVSDSLRRERATRDAFGIRAIRRGYGVSPETPHHEPLVSSSAPRGRRARRRRRRLPGGGVRRARVSSEGVEGFFPRAKKKKKKKRRVAPDSRTLRSRTRRALIPECGG